MIKCKLVMIDNFSNENPPSEIYFFVDKLLINNEQ